MHDTKKKLLASAAYLFTKKSYHDTSVLELAAQIGMHKQIIYHYFSSKEDLLNETVEMAIQDKNGILLLSLGMELSWNDKYTKISEKISRFFADELRHPDEIFGWLEYKLPGIKKCQQL